MAMFLEPSGQALSWWEYYYSGRWGINWYPSVKASGAVGGVPIEYFRTYFLWGAFDGLIQWRVIVAVLVILGVLVFAYWVMKKILFS